MSPADGPAVAGGKPAAGRVELHTHLEGSVTPAGLIRLCDKYGEPGLASACLADDGTTFRFDGFHGFLDLFKRVTFVLREPSDFHAVALDLGRQLAADDVVYAEVTVSYGVLQKRGIDPLAVQGALAEAAREVRETRGVDIRWIADAVRQWGLDPAWRAFEAAVAAGRNLGVVGFGLGGDETAGPAAGFAPLFAAVRSEGLGVTIHAGEIPSMGPAAAESIRQAVDICGAARIGHGLAAAADPEVMAMLAAKNVFVELCPGSNLRTGGVGSWAEFPLRTFLDTGVPCCLNTDDRTFFGLDLAGEYERAAAHHGLTPTEAVGMQKAAMAAAFRDSLP
jgi:adenosine deaminase